MSSSPSTAELTNSLTSKMITKELASYRTPSMLTRSLSLDPLTRAREPTGNYYYSLSLALSKPSNETNNTTTPYFTYSIKLLLRLLVHSLAIL